MLILNIIFLAHVLDVSFCDLRVSVKASAIFIPTNGKLSIECVTNLPLAFGDTLELQKYVPFNGEGLTPGTKYSTAHLKEKLGKLPNVYPVVASTSQLFEPFTTSRFKLLSTSQGYKLLITAVTLFDSGLYRCEVFHKSMNISPLASSWIMLQVDASDPIIKKEEFVNGISLTNSSTIIYNSSSDQTLNFLLSLTSNGSILEGDFKLRINNVFMKLSLNRRVLNVQRHCGVGLTNWIDRLCYYVYTISFSTLISLKDAKNLHRSQLHFYLKNAHNDSSFDQRLIYLLQDVADLKFVSADEQRCSTEMISSHLNGEEVEMHCEFPKYWLKNINLRLVWKISHERAFQPYNTVKCSYPATMQECSHEVQSNYEGWFVCDVTHRMLDLKEVLPQVTQDDSCSKNFFLKRLPRIRFQFAYNATHVKYGLTISETYSEQLKRTFEFSHEGLDEIQQRQINRKFNLLSTIASSSVNASNKLVSDLATTFFLLFALTSL